MAARWGRVRLLTLLVFVLLVAGSLGAFALSRSVVDDQEQRLLSERASEVGALLTNAVDSAGASLRVLGPIGASRDPSAEALFAKSAGQLVAGGVKTVGVAAGDGGRFAVVAVVGDGPAEGGALAGQRQALAVRALAQDKGQLVSALITEKGETRVVFAERVAGSRAVIFEESMVDTSQPAPSTAESPFRELSVALYAGPREDPDRLIVTTEADSSLSGRVERVPFSVGADRWLLVTAARGSLAGSFAKNACWFLLTGGLLLALLAAAIVETLARRRAYALALVAERTAELEEALGELREIRAFLERLLTAAPVLVVRMAVPERRVTYVSPNTEQLFGVSAESALEPGFLRNRIHTDDRADVEAAGGRIEDGSSTRETVEYRVVRDAESFRWVSGVFVPETDDDGQVVAVLAYIVDVDARRRAEMAQREAQETADAANRAKSEFLSRMSHELRTPLNAVLGFGQLLEIDDLADAQRDAVGHILKGGRHLLDLINEVLDISRIEAGDLALSPEAVLAADLIQDAVDLIRPLADERGIQLVFDRTEACDCYVLGDRQRAKQVLLNLLSNAVKYNRPRGTVAVSCERPSDTRVAISVADTGMGIPSERIGMLFTPFERLGAEQTGEEGTGIGLALSKNLAEAMGGTLGVDSSLGQGTTFTFDLPRVEGPVQRYERLNGGIQPAAEPTAPRHVVLHIEDNLSNLTLVERVLAQRAGIEVVAAMQGRLGLELAREHHPVLVLLDLHLPDMDGEQVLQRLRDDPATASIPVVIVSADATPGRVQRLVSSGAVGYLTKPIDVRELLRLLDDAVAAPLTQL
ncbi:MAG TPA: ATP-binding protein [Thermoleophilaceae bacterium]|nr:ATP-binding protein [Thermoleophilaceae bacterium]